ncbi:hypothetical protein [Ekhidna sp.]|uniref:hypothetical protein n=1 Tax=Ekhidna sp. TaxID=2608089 RepID=UPI003B5015CD
MFLNWYLEALRWKVSVQVFEPISIQDAVRIILAGLSLNWVLPFTSGDLLVRLSQQVDKYQTTSAAVLNRGVMISFTAIIGLYGMSKLAEQYDFNGWYALILLLIFPLMTWIFRKTLARFLNYFRSIDRSILIKIVGISFLRYTVFTFQFFLLLETFLPHLPAHLLIAGIGWIFLVRSILPLLLGGVGVREVSGIVFFESHVSNLQMVIIPIFLIWVINTVIPSLVGLIFIWRFKANIAR